MMLERFSFGKIEDIDVGSVVGLHIAHGILFGLIGSRRSNASKENKCFIPLTADAKSTLGSDAFFDVAVLSGLHAITIYGAKVFPVIRSGAMHSPTHSPAIFMSGDKLYLYVRSAQIERFFDLETGKDMDQAPVPRFALEYWSLQVKGTNGDWGELLSN